MRQSKRRCAPTFPWRTATQPSFPSAETSSAPETTGSAPLKPRAGAGAGRPPSPGTALLRASPRRRGPRPPRRSRWPLRGPRPECAGRAARLGSRAPGGSHVRLRHPDSRVPLVVPLNREIKRGTLAGVLHDAGVTGRPAHCRQSSLPGGRRWRRHRRGAAQGRRSTRTPRGRPTGPPCRPVEPGGVGAR